MRLKQIKLAGFKSFVDPTSFEVPSQLVGVVGPNGCGKSNIMDAVRWVLGESRASELRGESMQDVIFNGSSERKQASRASVELVFDNSLGRIGGHWAQYAEISVRRVLTRDGQSTYLINNQTVRRKDVHDMFLGTGLGPRAYAIIGQGMISRIIEAKPEEMRVFLEEAAGVSKYKERRRETENRLADTRENLTRVEDILRELGAQIDKLEKQAEVAQQFRRLEADRDRAQQMLWIVRRDEALAEQARIAAQAGEATNALESHVADLRSVELELEQMRQEQTAAGDEVHAVQGRFYEANAEVSRLEAEIRFVVDAQSQLQARRESLGTQSDRWAAERDDARQGVFQAEDGLTDATLRAETLAERVTMLADELPEVESRVRGMREQVDSARSEALATRQQIELSAVRRRTAEQARVEAERRQDRLEAESAQVDAPDDAAAEAMALSLEAAEVAEQSTAESLAAADDAWRDADGRRAPAQQALREAEGRLAQIEARIAALRQLQERVQSQGRINPWLERHGLERLSRLWQRLRIEHGWETAVEALLRERIGALQVERLDSLAGLAGDAPPAKVTFFSPGVVPTFTTEAIEGLQPLSARIQCNDAALQAMLTEWLRGAWAAGSIDEAVARRGQLPPGACFVTEAGHLVDRHSIRLYAADSEQDGVLARHFEIDNLEREVRAQRLLADGARDAAVRIEAAAGERRQQLAQARESHSQAVRRLSDVRLQAQQLEQARARAQSTRSRVAAELAEVGEAMARAQAVIDEEADAFERLDAALADRQQRVEDLAEESSQAEAALSDHRDVLRQAERERAQAQFDVREFQARIERLTQQASSAQDSIDAAASELAAVDERLAQLSDESARAGLQEALAVRVRAEQALAAARSRMDDLGMSVRERDEARLGAERELEPLRQRLVELQLKEQAARLNADQFAQQLLEFSVDETAIVAAFGASAPRATWLAGEVTRLGNAVAALGPVNLAALDELGQATERKTFLDAQLADLSSAIGTLEDAIRKIDRETRELLKDTYDSVNRHFGLLFPELFGGGEARLILTGDEILDAGIQVMAQPPGKRNASIHLLSGGEKALTAIALVFALFQLNPAPFCLLDEVDAPLDDANTERYADMVRRMSDHTQFLFITHNKIAMEMAQQLVGVTMQERGVSRIVAVDLDAAARMAEAA